MLLALKIIAGVVIALALGLAILTLTAEGVFMFYFQRKKLMRGTSPGLQGSFHRAMRTARFGRRKGEEPRVLVLVEPSDRAWVLRAAGRPGVIWLSQGFLDRASEADLQRTFLASLDRLRTRRLVLVSAVSQLKLLAVALLPEGACRTKLQLGFFATLRVLTLLPVLRTLDGWMNSFWMGHAKPTHHRPGGSPVFAGAVTRAGLSLSHALVIDPASSPVLFPFADR